jgi:hypothetical protein
MLGATGIAERASRIDATGRARRIAEASKILTPFEGKLSNFEWLFDRIASGPGKASKRSRKNGGMPARRRR